MKFHLIPIQLAKTERKKASNSWQEMESERREGLSSIPNVDGSCYSFFLGSNLARPINIKNKCPLIQ